MTPLSTTGWLEKELKIKEHQNLKPTGKVNSIANESLSLYKYIYEYKIWIDGTKTWTGKCVAKRRDLLQIKPESEDILNNNEKVKKELRLHEEVIMSLNAKTGKNYSSWSIVESWVDMGYEDGAILRIKDTSQILQLGENEMLKVESDGVTSRTAASEEIIKGRMDCVKQLVRELNHELNSDCSIPEWGKIVVCLVLKIFLYKEKKFQIMILFQSLLIWNFST